MNNQNSHHTSANSNSFIQDKISRNQRYYNKHISKLKSSTSTNKDSLSPKRQPYKFAEDTYSVQKQDQAQT